MQKNQQAFSLIECMIALALGLFVCTGIFSLFHAVEVLHDRQVSMSNLHSKIRFMTQFLREKIHIAGNNACVTTLSPVSSHIVQIFDADSAARSLDVRIKPETQLLLLQECVRFHNQLQYLPVAFFVGDTHRTNSNKQNINALFMQIGNHRREELITGVSDFQLHVYNDEQEKSVAAVSIDYLLTSLNGNTVTATLYAAVQRQLS